MVLLKSGEQVGFSPCGLRFFGTMLGYRSDPLLSLVTVIGLGHFILFFCEAFIGWLSYLGLRKIMLHGLRRAGGLNSYLWFGSFLLFF